MGLMARLGPTRSAPRYGSVLVHAGGGAQGDALVRDAVVLANALGACLMGVSTPCAGVPASSAVQHEAAELLIEAAGERFRAATSQVHAGSSWRKVLAERSAALSSYGWAADLLVADLAEAPGAGPAARELTAIMARTGRPVLVRTRPDRRLALRRAVIVGDGDAAGRRAVAAALPLLAKAEAVLVLPTASRPSASATRALADLERGLAWRNLPVEIARRDADRAQTLQARTLRLAPDVLVMSGRTRLGRRSPYALLERHDAYALLSL